MNISVVILAAGQGTRMRSALPKVLQPLAGQPLLAHAIAAARGLEQTETVANLASAATDGPAVLTVIEDDPSGYGRIIRDPTGAIVAIVEEKDATEDQRKIDEVNTGLLACPVNMLGPWLDALKSDNAQGEYYLTDIVASAVNDGIKVTAVRADSATEVMGINDKRQLAQAERAYQQRVADKLMEAGVTLTDPARIDVRGSLQCGSDVSIDVNTVFAGNVILGDNVSIGPNCVITDCAIGSGTQVKENCVLESAQVGSACDIGPYARLRPNADIKDQARVGNFVEIKNTILGEGSKANHLTYLGDAEIGSGVNVGCGTITCNYDGANKHKTVIGDNAFIGSGVELVAPVNIGAGATIGAGSTIGKDAPAGELTLERARQKTVPGWTRPTKNPSKN
jgi:bifunctional UDP-N-acetylglucosamine pyrophosphorylase/glucosamine-1-phosphate N-acetyltransferase